MRGNKPIKSFEIALSGIATAFAVIGLLAGYFSGILLATGYLVGVVALMLPLSKQFYLGGVLAYVGTCVLALIMGFVAEFWSLVPFIMFFGLHPLANSLQIRFKINKWLAFAIKAVWFDCTLIAAYFLIYGLSGASLPPAIENIIAGWRLYVIIFTAGSALFLIYDYLIFKIQILVNKLVFKIKK